MQIIFFNKTQHWWNVPGQEKATEHKGPIDTE